MNAEIIATVQRSKPNRIGNTLYNLDRMIASSIWGTSQETISSEVGRIARGARQVGEPLHGRAQLFFCRALAYWLDHTPKIWGVDHTEKAIVHADELDAVDDGHEQLREKVRIWHASKS